MTTQLNDDVLETVASHLSLNIDDDDDRETLDDIAADCELSASQIEAGWSEFVRDLSHLSREERKLVLERKADYSPETIGDCKVYLYGDVQTKPGERRISAAIVDAGSVRVVFYK